MVGTSIAARMARMTSTTMSSTRVKPFCSRRSRMASSIQQHSFGFLLLFLFAFAHFSAAFLSFSLSRCCVQCNIRSQNRRPCFEFCRFLHICPRLLVHFDGHSTFLSNRDIYRSPRADME